MHNIGPRPIFAMPIQPAQPDGLGFYVHIPYCRSKCNYCDFLSFPLSPSSEDQLHHYVSLLTQEISLLPAADTPIDSIFFGGGTPSLLSADDCECILASIAKRYAWKPDIEITVECNPGTVDLAKLEAYRSAGVNRISFGLQSLDERVLSAISRLHTAKEFWQSLAYAKEAGFSRISTDLIAGLPEQNEESLLQTLSALTSEPSLRHISLYALILEQDTPLYQAVEQGSIVLPSEESTVHMQRSAIRHLESTGFERYEISNFAQPGEECRHNLNTWHGGSYLAAGLGASSALRGEDGLLYRFRNETNLSRFAGAIRSAQLPIAEIEQVSQSDALFEALFLRLRLREGIPLDVFPHEFGIALEDLYPQSLEKHLRNAYLYYEDNALKMSELGWQWQNQVLLDFLEENENHDSDKNFS